MGIDPNIHIGEQYGIYVIDSVLPEKDKHGHYVYRGICQECGFEKCVTIYDFKNKIVEVCTHFSKLTKEQLKAWYNKNKKQCLYCGKDIPFNEKCFSSYKIKKFCNQSCAASYNNTKKERKLKRKYCAYCGKELPSNSQKYCSQKCQTDFQYQSYIIRWKNGEEDGIVQPYSLSSYIKRYLREKYNNRCSKCGWNKINQFTGKAPLEVHHKDGDYTNNSENNLELLCPNCHSLTETYKAGNIGNGRKCRQKYNKTIQN